MAIGQSPSASYLDIPIFNALYPKEGAKAVPVPLNFALQASYTVDLTILQQKGYMSVFQSVFIDNSQSSQPVTLQVQGSNQKIVCPGNSQGTFPIFVPGSAIFTVSSSGSAYVVLYLSNVPLPSCVWSATSSFAFSAAGYLEVTDVALDACVTGSNLNILENGTANNNVVKPVFLADELFTGSLVAATTATAATITTGNVSFFITSISLFSTITETTAADVVVTLKDGATVIITWPVFAPATANLAAPQQFNMNDLQYNSKGSAQTLTLNIGAAGAGVAGAIYYNIAGGLCSNIGP